jgi:hypothetical protein
MNIRETLNELGYKLVATEEWGDVYGISITGGNAYVSISEEPVTVQAVKMPDDADAVTTVVHFNHACEELTDLLRKWSDVTPATYSE